MKVSAKNVVDQSRSTRKQLVNDLRTFGSTVTKKTTSNTLRFNGLKYFSTHKVPLLKKAHQVHLKFANEDLNDSEKAWKNVGA